MQYLQKTYALVWRHAPLCLAAFIAASAAVHSEFMGERAKSAVLWTATALTCFSVFGPGYVSNSQSLPVVSAAELKDRAARVRVLSGLLLAAPVGALLMRGEPVLSSLMWFTAVVVLVTLSHAYHDLLLAKKRPFGQNIFGQATNNTSTASLPLTATPSPA